MNKTAGVIETENKVLCAECGNDLTVEGSVEMLFHQIGAAGSTTVYKCTKCGNEIERVCERNSEDMLWWEDEMKEAMGE